MCISSKKYKCVGKQNVKNKQLHNIMVFVYFKQHKSIGKKKDLALGHDYNY